MNSVKLSSMLRSAPKNVLIIKKISDQFNTDRLKNVGQLLVEKYNANVFVEAPVFRENFHRHFQCFNSAVDPMNIDFCVSIGGDGTLLHLNSLFQAACRVPPVLAFSSGTLGFLISFHESEIESVVDEVMTGNPPFFVAHRSRLRSQVRRGEAIISAYTVLNEVVVDKGEYLLAIPMEIHIDNDFLTTTRADGIIVSTPTGSTAYNMSAGGSMVAPSVAATTITPICPHTLSFRPILVHEKSVIRIKIPKLEGLERACITFDGQKRIALKVEDEVLLSLCDFSFPIVVRERDDFIWYRHLKEKLHWNKNRN